MELLSLLIKISAVISSLVVDTVIPCVRCFAGGGSDGVAAELLERAAGSGSSVPPGGLWERG